MTAMEAKHWNGSEWLSAGVGPVSLNPALAPALAAGCAKTRAVALANASVYALSTCVWSRDIDRPLRVARRLHAVLIRVNSWANIAVKFKESCSGRSCGLASVEDSLEYRQITQDFISRAR